MPFIRAPDGPCHYVQHVPLTTALVLKVREVPLVGDDVRAKPYRLPKVVFLELLDSADGSRRMLTLRGGACARCRRTSTQRGSQQEATVSSHFDAFASLSRFFQLLTDFAAALPSPCSRSSTPQRVRENCSDFLPVPFRTRRASVDDGCRAACCAP